MKNESKAGKPRFRFSALNSKVPVVGVSSVKSRIPHITRRDTARQYPAPASTLLREPRRSGGTSAPGGRIPRGEHPSGLLDFHLGAFGLKLGLDLLGLGLRYLLFDRFGGPIPEVFGLFQAQPGELPHYLDYLDLLLSNHLEDGVKLRLLLSLSRPGRSACCRHRSHRHGGGSGHAELLLQ